MYLSFGKIIRQRILLGCFAMFKLSAICLAFSAFLAASVNAELSDVEAVETIQKLQSRDRQERLKAVQKLDQSIPTAKVDDALTVLVEQLKIENDQAIKFWIISIIPSISVKSDNTAPAILKTRTIPALVEAFEDSNSRSMQLTAALALQRLGLSLQNQVDSLSLEQLEQAISDLDQVYTVLNVAEPDIGKKPASNISAAQKVLRTEYNSRLIKRITDFLQKNPWIQGAVILAILYSATLWLRPQWLLLLPTDIKLSWLMPIELPIAVVRFLKYRPRVLDAWVAARVQPVRDRFAQKRTVSDRQIHFFLIPVELDNKKHKLTPEDLKSHFARAVIRVLIYGQGGTGKTSVACQIANWVMTSNEAERLCNHLMAPVLIEGELSSEKSLKEAIRQELKSLTNEKELIPEELVVRLLVERRILVIIDHFSELSSETQAEIQASIESLPVNAFVITSRNEESLKDFTKTHLKPCSLNAELLSSFIGEYLTQLDKRSLYPDDLFLRACAHLKEIAGQRELTVLLAKLYAEQMIFTKKNGTDQDLPTSISSIILSYLNELNQTRNRKKSQFSNSDVRRDAKIIAWKCLKKTFQPSSAKLNDILEALREIDDTRDFKERLDYLGENHLGIVQQQDPEEHIRFVLDPIAEYLAALHLIDLNSADEWENLLNRIDDSRQSIDPIRDFLLALRDCCLAKKTETEIPEFVLERLDQVLAQR